MNPELSELTPEDIREEDILIFVCIKPFSTKLKRIFRGRFKKFMKPGWVTWAGREYFIQSDKFLLVEDNFYEINFPTSHFRLLATNQKPRKPKEDERD